MHRAEAGALACERRYFVLEGHDGAGKSTLHGLLERRLADRAGGRYCYHDPDPTLPLGALVYRLRAESIAAAAESRQLLWAAASIEAQGQALARSAPSGVILADRSPFTSFVDLTSLTVPRFFALHEGYRFPAVTFHLRIDPDLAFRRLIGRGQAEASAGWLRRAFAARADRYAEIYAAAAARGAVIRALAVGEQTRPEDLADEIEADMLCRRSPAEPAQARPPL